MALFSNASLGKSKYLLNERFKAQNPLCCGPLPIVKTPFLTNLAKDPNLLIFFISIHCRGTVLGGAHVSHSFILGYYF